MESSQWRNYRGHLITVRKTFLGFRRHDVWRDGKLIATFRDGVSAELHVDSLARAAI